MRSGLGMEEQPKKIGDLPNGHCLYIDCGITRLAYQKCYVYHTPPQKPVQNRPWSREKRKLPSRHASQGPMNKEGSGNIRCKVNHPPTHPGRFSRRYPQTHTRFRPCESSPESPRLHTGPPIIVCATQKCRGDHSLLFTPTTNK